MRESTANISEYLGNDSDESPFKKHGKFDQQKYLNENFTITDTQLEQFLTLNCDHVGLTRTGNQDEDVSLISWYAMKKFIVGIEIFIKVGLVSLDIPSILPYIFNIVNEQSPRISLQPKNFKGKLYPPQASILKRMLDIEMSPPSFNWPSVRNSDSTTEATSTEITPDPNNETATLYGGLITERLSFGKTFCLPALLCERLFPYESKKENVIKTNLIVCGTKVIKEWKNNLKNFTSFDFQVVETKSHLDTLEKLVDKKEYPDVIVVKDGDITWNNKKTKALGHTLGLFTNITFARIIYDDYDMLKLQPNSDVPDALFTWFVSGTDGGDNVYGLNFYMYRKNDKIIIPMRSAHFIMDATASIKCNREYSIVEYNIPKINVFYVNTKLIQDYYSVMALPTLIQKIINNEPIDHEKRNIFFDSSLFSGTKDVPYIYDRTNIKMLVAVEDKKKQNSLVIDLNNMGIKAIKLTRVNVDKFAREDTIVCVSGNLFGVNMGFLTHIVIDIEGFHDNSYTQIIGRGQRLSRKQNLQVYFYNSIALEESEGDGKECK